VTTAGNIMATVWGTKLHMICPLCGYITPDMLCKNDSVLVVVGCLGCLQVAFSPLLLKRNLVCRFGAGAPVLFKYMLDTVPKMENNQ